MQEFIQLPIFGVFISIIAFAGARELRKKFNYALLTPVLVAIVFIILFLFIFNIDFDTYNRGGKYISFFLGPSVVALGVFFYEKYEEVKQNLKVFLLSVAIGGITGVLTVIIFLLLLKVPDFIIESLAAKSVTTPIAIEITKLTGGIPEITAGIVIAVGIFGNAFGPFILKKLGIKSKIAIGTALGTAAHGIGTARAFEESKLAGVYSGLAMCVNGIITALITPYLIQLSFWGVS
ncbi:murein hydrolase effector protein LrgB [Salegentibacter salinarum]|uniref:Murein hydrolase effector protein LrgB n=1 Tax=Salegentibacter salinarum TaxID=447422 RepID=A0A2N0U2G7_9FLAO|nr:LrgB family protein [Salegentibacter salinarum]PKD21088.1 murein hydrolase effector protein LrgB [Salegentibacter salinarum]SKB75745.1 TIGR00659 family protein [Salegentibacter salinarum]